jgi:hypothetical protein
MTVEVADAHMHVQRLVSVVKMATVLEEYATKEHCSVVRFLWAKGLNTKDIHKEMFPVYGGKCLSRKAVHMWFEKFSQGRWEVADDARRSAEIAETTFKKRFLCGGFRCTGKAMGHVYQCWWRICREINVFSRFEHITRFTFSTHL